METKHPITGIPEQLERNLRENLSLWEPDLRELLPGLPPDIQILFNNNWLISFTGTGGFARTENSIDLAFDPNYQGDREKQLMDFRGTFYHEAYHLIQGFTGEDETLRHISLLDNSIYEGAATKFEVIRAGTNPGWSQYNPKIIYEWYEELSQLETNADYRKWKFYHPETGRRWIAYRTGSYIVDEALKHSGMEIEALASLKPSEILELSKIH